MNDGRVILSCEVIALDYTCIVELDCLSEQKYVRMAI